MEITVVEKEEAYILQVEGRVDSNNSRQFETALMKAIESADCIKIDFEKLAYLSSAGLRVLLNGQKKVNKEHKEMLVCNINDIVEEIFESTGFMNVLNVE